MEKYKANEYITGLNDEVNQVLAKFMIEAASICGSEYCRTRITDESGLYIYDFSLGGNSITDPGMNAQTNKLTVVFYEVRTDLKKAPAVERNVFNIVFRAVDGKGYNVAVENSMYRCFAAKFFEALEFFPGVFIKEGCYLGEDKIL